LNPNLWETYTQDIKVIDIKTGMLESDQKWTNIRQQVAETVHRLASLDTRRKLMLRRQLKVNITKDRQSRQWLADSLDWWNKKNLHIMQLFVIFNFSSTTIM